MASLNQIVQANSQMFDIWAGLGARWDNEKVALEDNMRVLESEIQRLSTSSVAQATSVVAAIPIDPKGPDFVEAALPVQPRPEMTVATAQLPAPPRRMFFICIYTLANPSVYSEPSAAH